MSRIRTCSVCGVPSVYSRGHVWNDNGTIVQRRNANNRLCLYEAEGLRKLIANIEELVGMPVDRIIVEGKRKASLQYLRDAFPDFKLKMARMLRSRLPVAGLIGPVCPLKVVLPSANKQTLRPDCSLRRMPSVVRASVVLFCLVMTPARRSSTKASRRFCMRPWPTTKLSGVLKTLATRIKSSSVTWLAITI